MDNLANVWRKCSSCKKPIQLGSKYFLCSVSTCNGQRTGYVFCSVSCFEVHLPGARHKDAAAMENTAPRTHESQEGTAPQSGEPKRSIVRSAGQTRTLNANTNVATSNREVLIIASRLKDYIQARSEMNTSSQVMDVLSDHVRAISDRAIENARADGRKTVLDRDFSFLKK